MSTLKFESCTSDVEKMNKVRQNYAAEVLRRRQNARRWRVAVVVMGFLAFMLRLGIQTNVSAFGNPIEIVADQVGSLVAHKWYQHPIVLFLACGLMTPMPLFYVLAREEKGNLLLFFVKLADTYVSYLRGMFTTSILVDLLQAGFKTGPPTTLFSALCRYFQGHGWIDPYLETERLSFPSFQTTISSYVTCFCLMIINKTINTRMEDRPISKFILRVFTICAVVPTVVVLCFPCYQVYMTSKSPVFIEIYYLSVLLGMITAIFEVQGTLEQDPPLAHYHVIMRKVSHKSVLAAGLEVTSPADNGKDTNKLAYIAVECLREYQRPKKQPKAKPTKPAKSAKPGQPNDKATIKENGEKAN